MSKLLEIKNLSVQYETDSGLVHAVNHLDLSVGRGETLGFVGETGAGKFIVMTTQVQNDGSDLGVYHVGYSLKGRDHILEAYDMTTECVVAKIMWILGQTKDPDAVKEQFYRPVSMDIIRRE
jgi:ABC-type dipeptide/oligopeptide/nickel transport system ATPase component